MTVSVDQSVLVTTFSDDTTVEGCIENADVTAYRDEVQRMCGWCADNILKLKGSKKACECFKTGSFYDMAVDSKAFP